MNKSQIEVGGASYQGFPEEWSAIPVFRGVITRGELPDLVGGLARGFALQAQRYRTARKKLGPPWLTVADHPLGAIVAGLRVLWRHATPETRCYIAMAVKLWRGNYVERCEIRVVRREQRRLAKEN